MILINKYRSAVFYTSLGLICLIINAFCFLEVRAQENDNFKNSVLQTDNGKIVVKGYPFWPEYSKTPAEKIARQEWIEKDHIIKGWDWSLPPEISVSESSRLCMYRRFNTFKFGNPPEIDFPANQVVSVWINWNSLEPEENQYRFDKLKDLIKTAENRGYGVIIRPLTAVWERQSYPDTSKVLNKVAPDYLVNKYGVPKVKEDPKSNFRIVNLDVTHPKFHERYLKFAREFGQSGIPRMDAVKGIIVGYKSESWGDESIGPHSMSPDDEPRHVRERLDTWAKASRGVEYKVAMGGESEYGLELGFGTRDGFVEKYLYKIPSKYRGQRLNDKGYLITEPVNFVTNKRIYGDENEEYDEWWTERAGRFGYTTHSYPYRYFTSMLRLMQMRKNYLLHNDFSLIPELLAYTSLEMGRNVENTPDAWAFLRESYIRYGLYANRMWRNRKMKPEEKESGVPAKNFERWLYQRDKENFETSPAVKIDQPPNMWMVPDDKTYDYIARRGKQMGFALDDRFLQGGPHRVAIKISYIDATKGELVLEYNTKHNSQKNTIELKNTNQLKTATFIVYDAYFNSMDNEYDIILKGGKSKDGSNDIIVSFLRVVKL